MPYFLFRASGRDFYNESVFKVTFIEYVIRDQDSQPRLVRPRFASGPGLVDPRGDGTSAEGLHALCPRNDPYIGPAVAGIEFTSLPRLEGTFEHSLYRFVEIAVRLCCTAESSCAPGCEPWNASLAKLHSYDANLVMIPRGSRLSQQSDRTTFNSFSYQTEHGFLLREDVLARARPVDPDI